MKFGLKFGVTIFAISAGSLAIAADVNSDSPLKAAPAKQVTAYDLSTTYGSDTVRMVLTQNAGASQYSTLINNKLVASATVAKDSSAASFAAYVDTSAKAISGVGADPAQFGLALSAPAKNDSGLKLDGLKSLLVEGAKPAASSAPLAKSVD